MNVSFTNHLWLTFIEKTQQDYFIFVTTPLDVYKYLVRYWKHYISVNETTKFNKNIEDLSTSIVTLIIIYELSHENDATLVCTEVF